jgi:hypothetical protein
MTVGEVFSKAFELWKKDVLWLILAGLVIGVILWAVVLVAGLIVGGLVAGGVAIGVSGGTDTFSGLGAAALFGTVIVGIIAVFLIAVLGTTLQGGLFEMVLGAAKHNRPVKFSDVFSGFRRFGSYAMFALVLAGIGIGFILLSITLIGIPIAIALAIWIGVIWLYVLPLITDQDLSFGDAQRRSREMVKTLGFWRTLGQIILLVLIIAVVDMIVGVLFGGGASDPGSAAYTAYQFVLMIVSAIWSTYTVCYISVMYMGSGGTQQPAVAGAYGAAPPPPPPGAGTFTAPPAPPAPPTAPITPASGPAAPVTPTAAATPSAPVTPPVTPAEAAPVAPAESEQTAATLGADAPSETAPEAEKEAADTSGAAPEAPAAPQSPPAPPASSPPPPPPLT